MNVVYQRKIKNRKKKQKNPGIIDKYTNFIKEHKQLSCNDHFSSF